ncbi:MAG: alpha/beta hydrolase [Pseudomonadota bacterium]
MRLILLLASFMLLLGEAVAAPPHEEPIIFEADDGSSVEAFQGAFEVPENRTNPDSRTLTIGYVRFPATTHTPGAPIVYLAGGPGGSGTGTARGPRFPLFMAMREHADVIAFDQRGTGLSDQIDRCVADQREPHDEIISDQLMIERYREAFTDCVVVWEEQGVDIRGYTTLESVADIDALRDHLGAEKVSLWGISYGTHLALAAVKVMENRIDRVVLASVEGLDQTVKLPSRTDNYFDVLQAAVNTQASAQDAYPDIKALISRVHARLEDEPVTLTIPLRDGTTDTRVWTRRDMQLLATRMIADPDNAVFLLQLYAAADAGNYEPITFVLSRYHSPDDRIGFNGMSAGMDLASGITPQRLARFEHEAASALMGQWHNFPMPQLSGTVPELDLGDEFRSSPISDIPALVLMGTLDGRTYPESQLEAVAGMTNVTAITVVNAGHNLFMSSPKVREAMDAFFEGQEAPSKEITIPLPQFITE